MQTLTIDNFAGGLNLRDSPNQIPQWESPNMVNMVITERGGLKRRNGCQNITALPGSTGTKADIFYSAALDQWLCARSNGITLTLYTAASSPSSWTSRGTINTVTTARAGFVDFPGATPKVVISTNVNSGAVKGIQTWDGTTLVDLAAGDNVCGDAIALWQNKVWVAGYPTSDANGNPTTLRWCDAGDPTTWTATNVQQFRDLDAKPLTGLGVTGGALIVFKKRSAYRVTDSSTGSFVTIDPQVGCVNPRAVTSLRGRLYLWGAEGIYEADGSSALKNVGDKIRPVFYNRDDTTSVCAGVFQDHVVFSSVSGGSYEIYDVAPTGGIVKHTLPGSQDEVSSFSPKESTLYAAIADGDDLFTMFTGTGSTMGKDDSTGYVAGWRTPWLQPNSGLLGRLQQAQVQGLSGTSVVISFLLYKDWDETNTVGNFDISTALQGTSQVQTTAPIRALPHGTAFQIQVATGTENGSNTDLSLRAILFVTNELQYPNPGYPTSLRNSPPAGRREPAQ